MIGSAQAGKKVQQGALVAFDQDAEGLFLAFTHQDHEGEIIGFWLDGSGHEKAFWAQYKARQRWNG